MKRAIISFFELTMAILLLLPSANAMTLRREQGKARSAQPNRSGSFGIVAVLERNELRFDEPLILRLSIKNVGRGFVFLFESNPETDYRLAVTDATGKPVSLTEHGKQILSTAEEVRLVTFKLRPGEERLSVVQVNKIFEMSKPGTYYIVAARKVPATARDFNRLINIKSNRVRVVITKA